MYTWSVDRSLFPLDSLSMFPPVYWALTLFVNQGAPTIPVFPFNPNLALTPLKGIKTNHLIYNICWRCIYSSDCEIKGAQPEEINTAFLFFFLPPATDIYLPKHEQSTIFTHSCSKNRWNVVSYYYASYKCVKADKTEPCKQTCNAHQINEQYINTDNAYDYQKKTVHTMNTQTSANFDTIFIDMPWWNVSCMFWKINVFCSQTYDLQLSSWWTYSRQRSSLITPDQVSGGVLGSDKTPSSTLHFVF
jgi:hypothetical protein